MSGFFGNVLGLLDLLGGALTSEAGVWVLVAGLAVVIVWLVVDRYLFERNRLSWRVVFDSGLNLSLPGEFGELEHFFRGRKVDNPSMVILSIRNSGSTDVAEHEYVSRLRFTFGPREVRAVKVSEASDDIKEKFNTELEHSGNEVTLPKVHLNRRERFKFAVLLSGTDKGVRQSRGQLHGGLIQDEAAQRRVTRKRVLRWLAATLAPMVLVVLVVSTRANPDDCGGDGQLRLIGSTAFAPIAEEITKSYLTGCAGTEIKVEPNSSLEGLQQLQAAGATERLATISDGHAGDLAPELRPKPLAAIVFSVVVNEEVAKQGITDLTLDQLRRIYAGEYTNWGQLKPGVNLPIRIVSRTGSSGSRTTFEKYVLGFPEDRLSPSLTSQFCETNDRNPAVPWIRCERHRTNELLDRVNAVDGAIGYAEAQLAADRAKYPKLVRLRLGGKEPIYEHIDPKQDSSYPFWTVEYLYTNGTPSAASILGHFQRHLGSDPARERLRAASYLPCAKGEDVVLELCRNPR